MESFWMQLCGGLLLMALVMSATWWLGKRWNNFSIVDSVWALSFSLVSGFYVLFAEGWWLRKVVIFAVVSIWSLRLTYFLSRRIYSHHPAEDSRYRTLREEYGANLGWRFYLFFQYQGVSVVLLSLLFLEPLNNSTPHLTVLEWCGIAVSLVSLVGESIADAQAQKFKSNPENQRKVCDVGLWKYSRHPNYFFESMIWWGFYIAALGTPGAAYTIFAPLFILFILVKVTGIPPSEAQALQKRGDAYRAYQARTSAFIPWFPRKGD
ncbi:DUF1295 domain-containing protein [Bdellovibrio sp. KM01]|uniref:DUF1295 domain-containing protein n=1 Tax=Bdellovibrio sp. KM01 TaxID=2748865 RepID=UPI0015E90DAE|nr:DUF1295 domain-containing protein [Bdellovibrio sp. KM01]QLY26418.1 DUF1295 domain-containing protein [Bdellovibrio sp. KM01]